MADNDRSAEMDTYSGTYTQGVYTIDHVVINQPGQSPPHQPTLADPSIHAQPSQTLPYEPTSSDIFNYTQSSQPLPHHVRESFNESPSMTPYNYQEQYAMEHTGYDQSSEPPPAYTQSVYKGSPPSYGHVEQDNQIGAPHEFNPEVYAANQMTQNDQVPIINDPDEPIPDLDAECAFAVLVTLCCNLPCGVIALLIVDQGRSATTATEARQAGKLSVAFSITGIILSIIILIVATTVLYV